MLLGHVLVHSHKFGHVFFMIVVFPFSCSMLLTFQLVGAYYYSSYFGLTDLTMVLVTRK